MAKKEKSNHAIHQCCKPVICGVYLRSRENRSYACSFSLRGFPSTPLTELLMESEKQKQFAETTELIETTEPDRFLVILPGPAEAHSHPQKLPNKTDNESRGVRFGAVKRNKTSRRKLCKHFYNMLKSAIREAFIAP